MTLELSCASVRAGYGPREILRSVSCRFGPSRLHAILGANGAGKTTLLRTISGTLPLRGGTIQLGACDLTRLSARERALHVALVPQLAAETIPLSVREAVALARYPHQRSWRIPDDIEHPAVLAALQALGLERYATTPCASLSGGEWRRVLIAQGLAQEADVLLLDEPTAFLDPPARVRIMATLRELAHGNGLIIAVVLHDPDLALKYCDDAVLLRAGTVLNAGPVAEVMTETGLEQLYAGLPEPVGKLEVA